MNVEKKQKKKDPDFSVFILKCLLHIAFSMAILYDALVQVRYIIFHYTQRATGNDRLAFILHE